MNTTNNQMTIAGSIFDGNIASLYGGAIYSYSNNDYMTIIDSRAYNYSVYYSLWNAYHFAAGNLYEKNISFPTNDDSKPTTFILGLCDIGLSEDMYFIVYLDGMKILEYSDATTLFPGVNQPCLRLNGYKLRVVFQTTNVAYCSLSNCGFSYFVNPVSNADEIVIVDDDDGSNGADKNNHISSVAKVIREERNQEQLIGLAGNTIQYPFMHIKHVLRKHNSYEPNEVRLSEVYFASSDPSTVSTTFIGNIANGNGGAIFFHDSNRYTNILHATFTENQSKTNGGAIYSQFLQSALLLMNSVFSWNEAQTNGGAIAILGGCYAHQIIGNIFFGNFAEI